MRLPVQHPILDGLGEVVGLDVVLTVEVGWCG